MAHEASKFVCNRVLIEDLQLKARTILDELIPINSEVVLLDYPHYPNVGDSMIWLGEIAYLKSRNVKLVYVGSVHSYSFNQLKTVCTKNTLILLNGGGNFGDLWPNLHAFKLRVMRDFPSHRIIQLPQTIHFEQDISLRETSEAIKQHGQFTLLVRSQNCLDYAKLHFVCNTLLCPDMAFFIGPLTPTQAPVVDRFVLSRTDKEKSANAGTSKSLIESSLSVEQDDWLQESFAEKMMRRVEKYTSIYRRYFDKNNLLLLHVWNRLCLLRLKRGIDMLGRGKVVITDRLHAHILCVLINKPHILMDNSYGKLSNFYNTWTFNVKSTTVGARHVD